MANDEREDLADGVEHLQAAAREVIRAGRSLLDAAEGLVEDPAALQGMLGTLSGLATAAIKRFGVHGGAATPGDEDDDGKVQRITLS